MKRKVLCVVMALAMLLLSTACGAGSPAGGEQPGGKKDWKIAYIGGATENEWYVQTERGVKEWAEETGINAYYKGTAANDPAQQAQLISDAAAQGVDAILFVPDSPEALEPALQSARDKGVLVIGTEAAGMENRDYDVEPCTPSHYGEFIMQNLAELMGEEGKYVCMVGTLTTTAQNAWADAGIAYQEKNYPNMECIEERLESHQNVETAYERTKEILKKYPDIKGIFCTTSLDPPGAMKAIKEMGLQGKVFATGTCTMHTGEEYIKDGSLESITFWDPGLTAKVMCNLAVEILENGKESVKDGMDLGYEGYKSMKLEGDVLYGDALVKGTKDNFDQYPF